MKHIHARKTLFLSVIILLFTSCYEDYISIGLDYSKGTLISDHEIVFFHKINAGQPPKGISRFPDGGTQKVVYVNTSFYRYDTLNNELHKIFDFDGFPVSFMSGEVSIQQNILLFMANISYSWKRILNDTTDRYKDHKILKDKYSGFFIYNLENENITHLKYDGYDPVLSPDATQIIYLTEDTLGVKLWHLNISKNENRFIKTIKSDSRFIDFFWQDNEHIVYEDNDKLMMFDLNTNLIIPFKGEQTVNKKNEISIRKVIDLTSHITFKEWGFDLKEHWARTQKEYINDIIPLNGNLNYRKVIMEEIGNDLSNDDIDRILKGMDKYEETLEGYKKSEYNYFSKETKDLIKQYLK